MTASTHQTAFSQDHNQPASSDELVRYWTDQGESALDLAIAALTRVDELGGGTPSDLGILCDKLGILRTLMND